MNQKPTPPRFVPTLNETVNGLNEPATVVQDSRYAHDKQRASSAMLDLDLGELGDDASRLAAHASADGPASPSETGQAMTAAAQGVAVPQDPPADAAGSALDLPDDWQHQVRQAVQHVVRQELQQQLPFLLLQWSRQIEERVTPQIEQHMQELVQTWRAVRD